MFEMIYTRKSVRQYTGEKISREDLQSILNVAQSAAVGRGDYDKVLLTVISNQDLIAEIENNDSKILEEESHPFFYAPELILISIKPNGEKLVNSEFATAGSIAANINLAASALGVGSCLVWGAITRMLENRDIIQKLNLPAGYIPCGCVTLGKTEVSFTADSARHHIEIRYLSE